MCKNVEDYCVFLLKGFIKVIMNPLRVYVIILQIELNKRKIDHFHATEF